jgi:Zinc carboxypeptidase
MNAKALSVCTVLISSALFVADSPQPTTAQERPASSAIEPIERHPEWDAEYSRLIREATTDPQFATDLVDHLPASATVPTPKKFLGYIAGAPEHLTYAEDVHAYMRALEGVSPRVKVFTIGETEEGREMIAVAIADEATIASLDTYREITAKLSDPRTTSDEEARRLIAQGKPIYYLTGAMHSPETGSPEMLMELAYRLAVDDGAMISAIRANVITLITPVLEVDGRDRMVDIVRWKQANPSAGLPPLVYWGHYVAHDDNRDAIGLGLALTRNVLRTTLAWHPQVIHDLHESIPFLYISTGTGPYNAWLDPLVIDEFTRMADLEVQELTRKGLPGVWTHGFYDGWAPNYLFWVGLGHNAIGRFYETFGNHVPSTEDRVVRRWSDRAWFRPNPPLPTVKWSLRNNVNYQESGVLLALSDAASRRAHFMEQYWTLGKRSVAKARTEGPAAYVFDRGQKRQGQLRDLMTLLRAHGIEVQVADRPFSIKPEWPPAVPRQTGGDAKPGADGKIETKAQPKEETLAFPVGSFVVRMDQPLSRLADALLDTQYVRGEERVYDDTGWTLGYARNLEFKRIVNREVLAVPMHPWSGPIPARLAVKGVVLAIENAADTDLVRLRTALPEARLLVTEEEFKGAKSWPVGTILLPLDESSRAAVAGALATLDLRVETLEKMPAVKTHDLSLPRVAVLHTWLSTQDEGWYRLALEDLRVPYSYISTQQAAREPSLRAKYDVIIFPPVERGSSQDIVNGLPPGPPLPWRKTPLTPNLGVDSTDDIRPGLGFEGVANLRRFVQEGGLLITVQDTARWAVDFGLARWVKVVETPKLKASGSILQATFVDRASPVAWGYGETLPVYFDGSPVFKVGVFDRAERDAQRPSGRGGKDDPDVPQGRPFVAAPERPTPGPGEEGFQLPEDLRIFYEPYMPRVEDRPRVILAFPKEADTILLSGMLEGGEEIAGKPVVIDAPLGRGHVLLFANNPMWRVNTQGSYALVTNAILNFDHLGLGWPPAAR